MNCPFYFKIGACRHLDRCSRLHHKPAFSQTLLIKHLYQHPVRQAELLATSSGSTTPPDVSQEQATEDFFCFYEDMYTEFSKFGRIEEIHVADNLGDHMIGHVYVKFSDEEQASDAMSVMQGRYYDGRQMELEFSPVTDFVEARCRDYDEGMCDRGGFCNFLHAKPVPECLIRSMEEDCERDRRRHEEKEREERRHKKRKKERREDRKRSKRSRRERDRDREYSDDDDDDRSYSPSRSRSRSPE